MLHIKSISAFNDNYIWLIHNDEKRCAIVDPGEAAPVLQYLQEHQLIPDVILITHHHADHIGGVPDIVHHYPKVNVVTPKNEPIPTQTHAVIDGDQIELFDHRFSVMELPGHTLGHVAYVGDNKVFCGDVLFSAGCGRVFEGTMEQMYQSLNKLMTLPEETEVYCAHEYTTSNVAFAMAVEPDNQELKHYRDDVIRLRAQDKSTLPTTLKVQKAINPFLRTDEKTVIKSVTNRTIDTEPLSIFTALREWKNEF
ncbi:hydroxyacylglutathione hydrolase [Vibrio palustris]|uniref:Hydroxyacylglutathione hydrolase n=1 Tax=Vibrio palustris TaxID=1918946 RepID=A0A1R4B023_9VIBR|nr:hydroxyacylglutathione hydrolase [Vibrio palustris]SJL82262.1 Hydroxyacylglutathione hydrolase [Vibrio palustris]